MAKKIQGAEITFRISDDGTLKAVGQKAEKTAKSMDKLGGASQATDRRIKGVTQQSSNASKNFSKQAQTMQGGIVAVYATIAARVFAVSAAFQFLKEAFETRNLIEGQLAFGAATGVAYGTMTEGIIKASGGLIQFKEAAQAAAIGSAAGLTSDQLNRLGTAAKNTSLALGRDLTDSFNRLIRGTTKAEPELLDELGIILRLEPAMEKYALSIGKSKDDLNQFEKSQAVANEVLDQAETKFGAIEKTMDPAGFALQRFLKAFDDVMKGIKEKTTNFLIPVINFFANNILSLIGTMVLFLAPILKSIMPNFALMSDNLSQKAKDHAVTLGEERIALERLRNEYENFDSTMGTKDIANQDRDTEFAKQGVEKTSTSGHTRASKHFHAQTEKIEDGSLKKRTGKYKDFAADKVKILDDANDKVVNHSKKSFLKIRMHMGKTGKWFKVQTTAMKIRWAGTMKFMVRGAQMMATAVNWAMKAMGWIGMLLMLIDALKMLWQWIFPPDEAKKKQEEAFEEITEHYKNLNIELDRMIEAQELGVNNLVGSIQQIGSAFSSVDLTKVIKDYNSMLQLGKINTKEGEAMVADTVAKLTVLAGGDKRMQPFIDKLKEGKHISDTWIAEQGKTEDGGFMGLANDMMAAAAATKLLSEQQKSLNGAIKSVMGSIKQNKFTDVLKNYKTVLETMKLRGRAARVGMTGVLAGRDAALDTAGESRKAYEDYAAKKAHISPSQLTTGTKNKLANLKAQMELDEKAHKQQIQNVKDAEKAEKQWQDSKLKAEGIETSINALITEQYAITQRNLDLKLEGAKISTVNNTAEVKNARLDNKLLLQKVKLRERQNELDAANLALTMATNENMADTEWVAAANDAILQAEKNLDIEEETTDRLEEKTGWQQMMNELVEKELAFKQKLKKLNKERIRDEKKLKQLMKDQTSEWGKLETKLKQIADMQKATQIIREKMFESAIRLDTMIRMRDTGDKGYDEVKALAELRNFHNLQDQLVDSVTAQNDAYEDQIRLLKDIRGEAQHTLDMNKARLTMGGEGMFGGEAFQAMGRQFGGINPNAKKQREFLGKHKSTSWQDYQDKLQTALMEQQQSADFEQYKSDNPAGTKTREDFVVIGPAMEKFANEAKVSADNWKRMTVEAAQVGIELELASSIQGSMESAFTGMFTALIDGTKSFGDAMGDIMKQLLADLAAAYMKAAALKMLSSMGFGMPARYGGELTGPGYAAGGVANGPNSGYLATLHGREAVVPLGNDRSIPVDIRGASGNVVNVSISMQGGQSQTSASGGGDMQALGRSIGGLVQQHLQVEMRPGGLLNRQGAKGRGG
jgi:hypothetical protein